MINKRNAWQARSVLYVRLIPPGAADVAHYPREDSQGRQRAAHVYGQAELPQVLATTYTQFAYAGQPKPNQDPKLLSASYNSMEYSFDPHNIPQDVSGNIKGRIPDLPIVTLASAKASVPLGLVRLDSGGAQRGSRALERLGHRAAAARRSERRRIRVQESD